MFSSCFKNEIQFLHHGLQNNPYVIPTYSFLHILAPSSIEVSNIIQRCQSSMSPNLSHTVLVRVINANYHNKPA